jgi:hypothetical protein
LPSVPSPVLYVVQSDANAAEALSFWIRVSERIHVQTALARDTPGTNDGDEGCTSRSQKTHITDSRVVLYRWHPWHGQAVFVFTTVEKGDERIFRCSLDPAQTARPLEVPQWMFDTSVCSRAVLGTTPVAHWEALRELRLLLAATRRSTREAVVEIGHLDGVDLGGANATHESPAAGRSVQSVPSHSGHATMDAAAAGDAPESDSSTGATATSTSPTSHRRRSRTGGVR